MWLLFLPWRETVFGFLSLELTVGKEGEEFTSKSRICAWGTLSYPSGFANDPNSETQYCPRELSTHQQISMQERPEMRELNLSSFPHLFFLKISAPLPASLLCKQRSWLESYQLQSPRSQHAGVQQVTSARTDQTEDKEEWWEPP